MSFLNTYRDLLLTSVLNLEGKHFSQVGGDVDPKCYFGVMKQGEPHSSCVIRAIRAFREASTSVQNPTS